MVLTSLSIKSTPHMAPLSMGYKMQDGKARK